MPRGVARRLGRTEPFQFHDALVCAAQKALYRDGVETGQIELNRTADEALGRGPIWQAQIRHLGQFSRHGFVALVPAAAVVLERGELGPQNRRTQIVHASRAVRRLQSHLPEGGLRRTGEMPAIQHVRAREDGRAGHQVRVVGDD